MSVATIERERVTHLLEGAAERQLTVVCAPAGYGKTTALVTWVRTTGRRCAWVALDPTDDDPRRLWAHVVTALDRVLPYALGQARRALRGGSQVLETALPLTLDALAAQGDDELVLVFDDYHHLTAPACHELLAALLDGAPPSLRVAIATRTVPPLRLPRRRAAGVLAEVGGRELAFRDAETKLLLNGSLELGLAGEEIALVDERVAGWPAGLSLVAASLAERGDDGDRGAFLDALRRADGHVAEYLVEEVLDGLPAPLRRFLERTSILGRLDAGLCAAVLGDPAAGALFSQVLRSNLFVTVLDEEDGTWIRYHDVFRELLRARLDAHEPDLVRALHLRASRWLQRNGAPHEAIAHASAAGDGAQAAHLVYTANVDLLADGQYARVRRLIDEIPWPRGSYGPFCEALYTLSLQLDGAEPQLVYDRWQELRPRRGSLGTARVLDLALIWPFFGRAGEAVREGRLAYENHRDRSQAIWHSIAARLGLALWFAGERAEARTVIERHLDAIGPPNNHSWALAALAFCANDSGDAEEGERRAREAIGLAVEAGGQTALQFAIAYQPLADALRRQGRHDEARDVLGDVERVTRAQPGSLHHALTLVLRGELDVALHDRAHARLAVAPAREIVDRYPDPGLLSARTAALETMLAPRADDVLAGSAPSGAELRVLELLDSDLTLEAIAANRLRLSINTVKSHRRRLYRRLGVRSRADAVAVARERRLL